MSAELTVPPTSTPEAIPEQPALRACTECPGTLRVGQGFVPPLGVLYPRLGHGKPDRKFPLTETEVLSQEVCGSIRDKKKYGKLYTTTGTLNLMGQWAQNTLEAKEKRRQERQEEQRQAKIRRMQIFGSRLTGSKRPAREKSYINFVPPPAKEYVNEILAEVKPFVEKPGKLKRHHVRVPSGPASVGPKKYGEMRPVAKQSSKKKNKKGGEQDKSGKGKGR